MVDSDSGRTSFNSRLDELVQNVMSQRTSSPEFRAEYVKMSNLLRCVAECNRDLVRELLVGVLMFSYALAVGTITQIGT